MFYCLLEVYGLASPQQSLTKTRGEARLSLRFCVASLERISSVRLQPTETVPATSPWRCLPPGPPRVVPGRFWCGVVALSRNPRRPHSKVCESSVARVCFPKRAREHRCWRPMSKALNRTRRSAESVVCTPSTSAPKKCGDCKNIPCVARTLHPLFPNETWQPQSFPWRSTHRVSRGPFSTPSCVACHPDQAMSACPCSWSLPSFLFRR